MNFRSLQCIIPMGLLLLAAPCNAFFGQQNPTPSPLAQNGMEPPFKLSSKTNVVIVPVAVADKHGNHVSGLTANDFQVKEDGKVETIGSVEEITAEGFKSPAPPPVATPVSARAVPALHFSNQFAVDHPQKLQIIAIDRINTPFGSGTQQGLINFLAKNLQADTLLALVTFEPNGVRIIHNFTSDPAILIQDIKKLRERTDSGQTTLLATSDNTGGDLELAELQALFFEPLGRFTGEPIGSGAVAEARARIRNQKATLDASRSAQNALITLECLQQVAQYFAGVPGWKSLIWATKGFAYNLGSLPASVTRGTTINDWQRTMHSLQSANVAVYPVDVSGITADTQAPANLTSLLGGDNPLQRTRETSLRDVEDGALIDPDATVHTTLNKVAEISGGEAFYNSNNASDLFRHAAEDSSRYYLLSYTTSSTGKPGWRKLSVGVRKANVKVRARNGFFFGDSAKEAEIIRQEEEATALDSELNFTSLPLQGEWGKIEASGDKRIVHFVLTAPKGAITIDAEHENHMNLDVRIRAVSLNGQQAANIGVRLEQKLKPEALKNIQEHGINFADILTLQPGQYNVHFVVRDNLKGAMGNVIAPLKVE
jgi:VWFA-related protein